MSHNSVNFTGTNGHLVFSRTANITYRGDISGGIDLTQSGTGAVVLTGTNTYTGKTVVDGPGTLVIDGADAIDALDIGTNGLYVGSDLSAFGTVIGAASPAGASAAVPEPCTLVLLLAAAGFGTAAGWRRHSRRAYCPRSRA